MAVIMALLGSSVHTLAASWGRQPDRINASDVVARGRAVFRSDLQAMRHLSLGSDGAARPAFIGRGRTMTFLSNASQRPGRHELIVVQYTLERKNQSVQLVRRTGRFRADTPLARVAVHTPVVLVDNLTTAELSYRGASKPGQAWVRQWADAAALPRLVRLRLAVAASPDLPAVITRTRSEIEQQCIVSKAGRCSAARGSDQPQSDQAPNRERAR